MIASHFCLTCLGSPKTQVTYDYMWHAAMTPHNKKENTVYSSRSLKLIAVPWAWAVARKLERLEKHDANDIVSILELAMKRQPGFEWNNVSVEQWLRSECPDMHYECYTPQSLFQFQTRVRHVVALCRQNLFKRRQDQVMRYYEQAHHGSSPKNASQRPPQGWPTY